MFRRVCFVLTAVVMASAEAAVATTNAEYASDNINVPQGEICQPDDVMSALKQRFLIAPVDLKVRGLADRIPLQLDDVGSFGETRVGSDGESIFHAGTDLLADVNEPVLAVSDGLVVAEGNSNVLGNYVILRVLVTIPPLKACANDFIYAHLSDTAGLSGSEVKAGTALGRVGRTGNVGQAPTHLHIEYWTRSYLPGAQNRREWTRDIMGLFSF